MAFLQQSLENVACRFPGLTSEPFQPPRSDVDLTLPADPLLSSPHFTDDSGMQDSATAAVLAAATAMQQESLLRRQRMAASLCSAGFQFSSALASSSPLSWQSRLSNPLLNSSFLSSTIDPLGPSAAQLQLLESMVAATSPTSNATATLLNSSLLNSSLPNSSFLTHFTPSAKRAAPDASASDGKTQRPRKRGRPSYKDRAAAAAAAAAEAEAKKAAARAALRESAFGSAGPDSDRATSLGGTAPSAPQRKMQRILPRAVPMRAPLVPGLTQVPDSAALMAGLLPQATSDFSVALQAALEQARCRAALAEAFAGASAVGPSLEQRAQLWMARLTAAGAAGALPSAAPAAVDAALADMSQNNVSVGEAKLAAAAAGLLAAEGGDPKNALFSKLPPASRIDESAVEGAASRLVSASDAKEFSPPETGAAGTGGSSVTDVAANQSVGGASAAAAATPLPAGVLAIDWMFNNGPSDTKDSRFLLPETAADLEEHGDETAPSPHSQSQGKAAAEKTAVAAAGAAGAAGSNKGPSPTSTTFFRRQPADSTSSPPAVVVAAAFELLAKNMAPPPYAPRSFASLPAATASAAAVGRSVSDEPSSVAAMPVPQMLRRVSSHATAGPAGAAKVGDMRSVMMMVDEELRSLRQAGARSGAVATESSLQAEKRFKSSSAAARAYCIPVPSYLAVPTGAEDNTENVPVGKLESNVPMDLMPVASDCPVLNQASLDLTLKL
ncbi:unnamed protein product [Closterium sp. Yama58-4]|nr:unnamed protein product [Closterium sp. Yama58-4]